jgi:competence protein ComEC
MKEGACVELVAQLPKSFTPNPLSNYNMNRNNFYKEISAIGYSIGPVFEKDCKNKNKNDKTIISNIRNKIKTIVESNTAPNEGSIIKALTIGDRSLISNKLNENYRTSGLAHVLSISGMHMSIIALLVFLLVRLLLLPIGYGQYDFRKLASIISILVTFLYFLISGQTVSCIRAFVMTTLVLLGILFNRRAITLRLWDFALVVVVLLTPSAVINPGFLMSFSATLGLISYYEKKSHEIHEWLNKSNIILRNLLIGFSFYNCSCLTVFYHNNGRTGNSVII